MDTVLSDIYSVLRLFQAENDNRTKENLVIEASELIENIILADHLVFDKNNGKSWGIENILEKYSIPFELVELPQRRLNCIDPSTDESFESDALYYLSAARQLNAYLSLHHDRRGFLQRLSEPATHVTASKLAFDKVDQMYYECEAFKYFNATFSTPPLIEYILKYVSVYDIPLVDAINEIRESKHARSFRSWCKEVNAALREAQGRSMIPTMNRILLEIENQCTNWIQDIDEGIKYRTRRISLNKIWGIGSLLESIGMSDFQIKDPIIANIRTPDLILLNEIYQPKPTRHF